MTHNNHPTSTQQSGFTLVEIMIGLVIGMLAAAIILQVMSNFEAQKRVTTGSADAQTNGNIALYNIGRELQEAGFPLAPLKSSALECTTITYGSTGITSMSPISITDGTSDTVTVRYGTSQTGGSATQIDTLTGNDLTVQSNLGCVPGDNSLVINGFNCAFASVSSVPAAGASGSGVYRTLTLNDITAVATGANLTCLGKWNQVTFSVANGNLLRNGTPIMEGIVNLQAQYGISATGNSNQVAQWVDPNGSFATPLVADRNRIKAVRIAIVARNPKMEPKDPATNSCITTSACSSLSSANPTGLCAWDATSANPTTASPAPAINLGADPNWGCYRYRVFETIVPLRNVIWAKGTL